MSKYRPTADDVNNDVNEVVGLLKDNIEQIMERDTKLNDLEKHATNLGNELPFVLCCNHCRIIRVDGRSISNNVEKGSDEVLVGR